MRNVFCPNYNDCLSKAVEETTPGGSGSFKCDRCLYRHSKNEIDDLWPCFTLIVAICLPKLWEEFKDQITDRLSTEQIHEIINDIRGEYV
jgi:hypothetical protein